MQPLFFTLPDAEGIIQAGAAQQVLLDDITERMARGEFHGPAEATIPVVCKDGRFGGFHMLPNAAGGSETLFVADDLTNKLYAGDDGTTLLGYKNVLDRVVEQGFQVGGHDDEIHEDGTSGCGANDRLPAIYDFITRKADTIRTMAGQLGIDVSDVLHAKIVGNAATRTEFSSGADMLAVLESHDDEVIVEHLEGQHQEVVAVINTKEGTTLDRRAISERYGDQYESFNVDVWAFMNAARLLSGNPEQQHELAVAMVYYNLATAHVLCAPNMRVIVL